MTEEEMTARIVTLENQQAILVQALAEALQGHWVGFPSAEAHLYAIAPHLQGTLALDPPVVP